MALRYFNLGTESLDNDSKFDNSYVWRTDNLDELFDIYLITQKF